MLQPLTTALTEMAGRVRQVVRQANARVFKGLTQLPGKIVSVFEPHTEIIRKGKASKPTEFGKLVKIQEAENQIITHYEVFDERPSDRELLLSAVEAHEQILGRVPRLVAADAGFYSQAQERGSAGQGCEVGLGTESQHAEFGAEASWKRAAGSRKRRRGEPAAKDDIQAPPWPEPMPLSWCDGMKRWVGFG